MTDKGPIQTSEQGDLIASKNSYKMWDKAWNTDAHLLVNKLTPTSTSPTLMDIYRFVIDKDKEFMKLSLELSSQQQMLENSPHAIEMLKVNCTQFASLLEKGSKEFNDPDIKKAIESFINLIKTNNQIQQSDDLESQQKLSIQSKYKLAGELISRIRKEGINLDDFLKEKNLNQEKLFSSLDQYLSELFIYVIKHDDNGNATQLLIEQGVDVNERRGSGNTPLLVASANGKVHVVRKLVAAGAQINENKWGATPLIYLAEENDYNTVKSLLSVPLFSNSVEKCNFYGYNAMDYAILKGSEEMIRALKPNIYQEDMDRLKVLTHFGIFPLETNQATLNNIIRKYIDLPKPSREGIIAWKAEDVFMGGQCKAWSMVWGDYVSLGKEPEFIAIKQAIASTLLSGNTMNLEDPTLPSLIQRKYLYSNQQDLYKKFLNRNKEGEKNWFTDLIEKSKKTEKKEIHSFFQGLDLFCKKNAEEIEAIRIQLRKENDGESKKKLEKQLKQLEYIPSQELYKRLSKKYEEFKILSHKMKEKDPFKEILEDLFEKYNNRKDLLETLIPVLAIFQSTSKASSELTPRVEPEWRPVLSSLVGSQEITSLGPTLEINQLKGSSLTEVRKQIIEMLTFYGHFPGIYVDIGGDEHAVGFSVIKDRDGNIKYKYNDSNWIFEKDQGKGGDVNSFNTIEELTDHIIQFKYNFPKDPIDSQICVKFKPWKFNRANITSIPFVSPSSSSCGISELHYAIMRYTIDESDENKKNLYSYLKDLAADSSQLMQIEPGKNLLVCAISHLKDLETIKKILEIITAKDKSIYLRTLGIALEERASDQIIHYLIDKVNEENIDFNTTLYNITRKGSFQEIVLNHAIKYNASSDVIRRLVEKSDLSHRDYSDKTNLMYAVERSDPDIVELILKSSLSRRITLDLNVKCKYDSFNRKTVFDFAKGKPKILALLKDYEYKTRSAIQNEVTQTDTVKPSSPISLKDKDEMEEELLEEERVKEWEYWSNAWGIMAQTLVTRLHQLKVSSNESTQKAIGEIIESYFTLNKQYDDIVKKMADQLDEAEGDPRAIEKLKENCDKLVESFEHHRDKLEDLPIQVEIAEFIKTSKSKKQEQQGDAIGSPSPVSLKDKDKDEMEDIKELSEEESIREWEYWSNAWGIMAQTLVTRLHQLKVSSNESTQKAMGEIIESYFTLNKQYDDIVNEMANQLEVAEGDPRAIEKLKENCSTLAESFEQHRDKLKELPIQVEIAEFIKTSKSKQEQQGGAIESPSPVSLKEKDEMEDIKELSEEESIREWEYWSNAWGIMAKTLVTRLDQLKVSSNESTQKAIGEIIESYFTLNKQYDDIVNEMADELEVAEGDPRAIEKLKENCNVLAESFEYHRGKLKELPIQVEIAEFIKTSKSKKQEQQADIELTSPLPPKEKDNNEWDNWSKAWFLGRTLVNQLAGFKNTLNDDAQKAIGEIIETFIKISGEYDNNLDELRLKNNFTEARSIEMLKENCNKLVESFEQHGNSLKKVPIQNEIVEFIKTYKSKKQGQQADNIEPISPKREKLFFSSSTPPSAFLQPTEDFALYDKWTEVWEKIRKFEGELVVEMNGENVSSSERNIISAILKFSVEKNKNLGAMEKVDTRYNPTERKKYIEAARISCDDLVKYLENQSVKINDPRIRERIETLTSSVRKIASLESQQAILKTPTKKKT